MTEQTLTPDNEIKSAMRLLALLAEIDREKRLLKTNDRDELDDQRFCRDACAQIYPAVPKIDKRMQWTGSYKIMCAAAKYMTGHGNVDCVHCLFYIAEQAGFFYHTTDCVESDEPGLNRLKRLQKILAGVKSGKID